MNFLLKSSLVALDLLFVAFVFFLAYSSHELIFYLLGGGIGAWWIVTRLRQSVSLLFKEKE